jgi:carbon storage regulator CsrA
MLVLSRQKDQEIILTDGTQTIRILLVRAIGKVKIGIDAPDDWSIHRPEVEGAPISGATDIPVCASTPSPRHSDPGAPGSLPPQTPTPLSLSPRHSDTPNPDTPSPVPDPPINSQL